MENQLHQQVERYDIEDRVIFMGVRSDTERFYQCMDVFVLPTRFEGLGIVLIEAQVSGLPVVTSLERVPKETRVSKLINYVSLDSATYEEWAKAIIHWNNRYNRISPILCVKNNGYDINDEVKKLSNLYLNSLQID